MDRAEAIPLAEDRVADLRARWTPEATAAVARLLSVLCGAAGIATFGLLIASVTKKVMYR
jgi:hypothetical protein